MHLRRLVAPLLLTLALAACGTTTPAPAPERAEFPVVDRAALTEPQRRVVDVLEAQFTRQQPASVFSEGADEQWCADFVSWVMNAAGQPLVNPNSGYWRIPGVYTMAEYYRSARRLRPRGDTPVVGDVVLWDTGSPLGLHANVVVGVQDHDGLQLTTVGGNEEGGIRVRTTRVGHDTPLLGYGALAG